MCNATKFSVLITGFQNRMIQLSFSVQQWSVCLLLLVIISKSQNNILRGFKSQKRFNSKLQNEPFTLPEKAKKHFRQLGLSKNFAPRKLSSTQTLLLKYLHSIDASFTSKLKYNQRNLFYKILFPSKFPH